MSLAEAAESHVRRLQALIERGSVASLRRLYIQAQSELESKITRALGSGASRFTVLQYRTLLAQVHRGQMELAAQLGGALGKKTLEVQRAALKQVSLDVRRMERSVGGTVGTLPIEEAARFAGIVDRRKTSLLKLNASSMQSYGKHLVKKMEGQLSLSLATGESTGDAVRRVMETADVEWWRAERIVRTEQAWAYNATQLDALVANAEGFPDMRVRWTELVSDSTGAPLDNRVGVDSLAIHGQAVKPGGVFTMPATAPRADSEGRTRVPDSLVGLSWAHPPNRPNDRATLQPWRPGWGGVPAWEWSGGRRRPLGAKR